MSAATRPQGSPYPPHPPAEPPPYRLRVDQHQEIARRGIITASEPVEMLEGLLVTRPRKTIGHTHAAGMLINLFVRRLPDCLLAMKYSPVTLADSEPEPDIGVLFGSMEDYRRIKRHPVAAEVPLVIEVADLSLAEDRYARGRVYARAAIPEFWVVNIIDRLVEVYTEPGAEDDPPRYLARRDYAVGDEVPMVLDGVEVLRVRVADLFA